MTKLPTGRHTQTMKSAEKNRERYLRNKALRSRAKNFIRKIKDALDNGKIEEAKKLLSEASSYVDKAAVKGAFHKKKASRLKSRISKKINNSETGK